MTVSHPEPARTHSSKLPAVASMNRPLTIWHGTIHVLRRPSDATQYPSTTGAHSSFSENGSSASENSPTAAYVAPAALSRNGSEPPANPSGTPCSMYSTVSSPKSGQNVSVTMPVLSPSTSKKASSLITTPPLRSITSVSRSIQALLRIMICWHGHYRLVKSVMESEGDYEDLPMFGMNDDDEEASLFFSFGFLC